MAETSWGKDNLSTVPKRAVRFETTQPNERRDRRSKFIWVKSLNPVQTYPNHGNLDFHTKPLSSGKRQTRKEQNTYLVVKAKMPMRETKLAMSVICIFMKIKFPDSFSREF